MGLSIINIRSALEFNERGFFSNKDKIIDLGSQELMIKKKDFISILDSYGLSPNLKDFPSIEKDVWPKKQYPRDSTRNFWKLLGFKEHYCSDINHQQGSIYIDLNMPLDEKFADKYDLVTDFGNNEHAFNIAEAYKTTHKLCKKDGLIWVNQTLFGGNGYYNFDISFFESIAAVNRYKILCSYFGLKTNNGDGIRVPLSLSMLDLLDLNKIETLQVSYLFRKTNNDEFKFPYQGVGDVSQDLTYRSSLYPETTHLGISQSRAYIPDKITGKRALKFLINGIKNKLKKK